MRSHPTHKVAGAALAQEFGEPRLMLRFLVEDCQRQALGPIVLSSVQTAKALAEMTTRRISLSVSVTEVSMEVFISSSFATVMVLLTSI